MTEEQKKELAVASKVVKGDPELSEFMDRVQERLDLYEQKKPVVEPR